MLETNPGGQIRFPDQGVRVWPGTIGPALKAGATAGLLGGGAMALWMVGRALLRGVEWTTPLRMLGAPLPLDRLPLDPGYATIVGGAAMHLLLAAALGLLFAALVPYTRSAGKTLLLALGYALLVMAVMTLAVLPLANPPLRAAVSGMAGSWLAMHLLFGLALSLVPVLRTRFSEPV